ncbi:MAG: hypothetical protein J0M04_22560 [Verrucomicrobia bacterium]|nr:hypothetical protein [Verrucomicrobiota bacterium]
MKRKLLLLCFSATVPLAAQDTLFPAARTVSDVPPPVIQGTVADGTPAPAAPAPAKPAPAVLRAVRINRVYGWQVNAWMRVEDITVHPQTTERYDGESGDGRHIDAYSDFLTDLTDSRKDPGADLNMIVLDKVDLTLDGDLCCGLHIGPDNGFFVVTAYADGTEVSVPSVCATATHEFGHVFELDHPDQGLGPAPLPGTVRAERVMNSIAYGGRRLVKAEWDKFEEWAKARPNGDN